MIKTATEYGLQGAFKVDIFDANDKLIESTDFFTNFVTQSGLKYPSIYAYPDCMRFLTLGQGTIANSATGNAAALRYQTTGIQDPVNTNGLITTSDGGFQSVSYMGRDYYYGGADAGCGTLVAKSGPIYYRAWSIPTGNKLTSTAVNINEFMVSPNSGSAPTGRHAFSRVVKSVTIPANSKSIISYQLQVKILQTGIAALNSGAFVTGQGNVDNDASLLAEWAVQSGYYRQIHHGLRLIDIYGSTYTPKWGDGMEPSRADVSKFRGYFSPDNAQFDVSVTGGAGLSEAAAYAADGLSKVYFGQDLTVDSNRAAEENDEYYAVGDLPNTVLPGAVTNDVPANIRYKTVVAPETLDYRNEVSNINFNTPVNDYLTRATPISIATPGATGYNSELIDIGDKAVFSALTINLPYTYSGARSQRQTRKLFFAPVNSLGHNSRFGSFVLAYQNSTNYYPYVDALLYDNSGRALMQHYRNITGIQFTNSGTGFSQGALVPSAGLPFYLNVFVNSSGVVTGYEVPSDTTGYGIVNHSLTANTPPNGSGNLYWPTVRGSVIRPVTTGTVYSTSGFTVADPDRHFPTGQMVCNLLMRPMDQSSGLLDYSWVNYYPEQAPQQSGVGFTYWNGFYLTTVRYTGAATLDAGAGDETYFGTEVGLATSRYTNLRLTGYIGTPAQIIPNAEGIVLRSIPGSYIGTFTPNARSLNIQYRSGVSNEITQGFRVQDMFSGGLTQRLSGQGYTYNSGELLAFAVTGLIYDNTLAMEKPVYITAMTGNYSISPAYQWSAHSYLSGSVLMTSFSPPTGNFLHNESYRLLPNHGYPQAIASGESYPVNFGGTYPALSFDNTLEMYVDLIWSANCGTALDCTDPS